MSDSYRKNVFSTWYGTGRMKTWRTQENRRLRHNAKILIQTCNEWDSLIIPVLNDYDTLWGSPNDGRKKPLKVPYLNECEVAKHKARNSSRCISKSDAENGHYTKCRCYSNKLNYYWKTKRQ